MSSKLAPVQTKKSSFLLVVVSKLWRKLYFRAAPGFLYERLLPAPLPLPYFGFLACFVLTIVASVSACDVLAVRQTLRPANEPFPLLSL